MTRPALVARGAAAAVAAVVLAGALVACGDDPIVFGRLRLPVTLTPSALALVAGDSAAVRMAFVPGPTERTRVRWVSDAPAVAWAESTWRLGIAAASAPVVVHAVRPGTAVLTVVISDAGETISGAVPVTVSAAR